MGTNKILYITPYWSVINEGKGVIIYIADSKTTHVDVDRYLADDAITVSARYRFKWFLYL